MSFVVLRGSTYRCRRSFVASSDITHTRERSTCGMPNTTQQDRVPTRRLFVTNFFFSRKGGEGVFTLSFDGGGSYKYGHFSPTLVF